MSELNELQQRIADTKEGFIVVDAGPGTGKTHTIVERYVNIIKQPDVSPKDVLLLTYTNNAAAEMDERIKDRLTASGMEKDSKLVQTKTFDAFCLSVVLDSPDLVSDFFGIKEKLTRSATLHQNDTLNTDFFGRFLDDFMNRRGFDYNDIGVIASQNASSVMQLIYKLMSLGVIPLKKGWFGKDWERDLEGDTELILRELQRKNAIEKDTNPLLDSLNKIESSKVFERPEPPFGEGLSEEDLRSIACPDRSDLYRFVHDVYYEYIKRSISDNRLTFGLNAMLAFTVLYSNPSVRERNSFRYLMIDEFQDTNANQLMISLMIAQQPNLCVVGDWKQGIYGFRFVSIDNILNFEKKCVEMRRFLNDDVVRIPFQIPEVTQISLVDNYRSSQAIIDAGFRCMEMDVERGPAESFPDEKVVPLKQCREDIGDDTAVRYVKSDTKEGEVADTIAAITDYIHSGNYLIHSGDSVRAPGYGDIAIICRKTMDCRLMMSACEAAGIPAYLQGDVQIMSTREGKLALAWLKFVNNDRDPWGYVPIMADMDYTPLEIMEATKDYTHIPLSLMEQRDKLYSKRRRITELMTSLFAYYDLDNDITQALISTVSSLHNGSLITISDIIRIIEDGIETDATYPVENYIDSDAVTILTMHKSKGLEYPIVICPFIDSGTIPSSRTDNDVFMFDETLGIRCSQEIGRFGDYSKICVDWRTKLAKTAIGTDRSEEARLMFVSMTRAKQYETIISGPKPSKFMTELSKEEYSTIPKVEMREHDHDDQSIAIPEIPAYKRRRMKIGVHEILNFEDADGISNVEGCDEMCGKGMEYGTKIHELARIMCDRGVIDETAYPELAEVRRILDSIEGCDYPYAEIECGLPIDDMNVTLRGVIDLLVLYPDRIEIHDYKTDVSDRFESEYIMQLSIYAHAANQYYHKNVRCFIDYVSRGISKEINILPMDDIRQRVMAYTQCFND